MIVDWMTKTVQKYAPAKINLSLRILEKRVDGYHNIETLFLTIGLWDHLLLKKATDQQIRLKVVNSDIPADETNLCHQAAKIFAQDFSGFEGCHIILRKQIPDGAGLGGGSSDAAAALLGLNELYNKPFPLDRLTVMAAQLGADVPFFLKNGLAIGRGKGDNLDYINKKWDFSVLVLCPNYKISTCWAYSNYKIPLTNEEKNVILKSQFLYEIQIDDFFKVFANNFESLVFVHYPELKTLKQELYHRGAFFASLSGTGSAVYGLFRGDGEAESAKAFFDKTIHCFIANPIYT